MKLFLKKTSTIVFLTALIGTMVGQYLPRIPNMIFAASSAPSVQVTPINSSSSKLSVTFSESVTDGDIADFELFDGSNQKVWQRYSNIGSDNYAMTVNNLPNGTYKLNVGLFKPNWASNYGWYTGIATLTFPTTGTTQVSVSPTQTASVTSGTSTPTNAPVLTPTPTPTPIVQQSIALSNAQSAYNSWRAKYIASVDPVSSRVIRPENNNDTVSEGIGYGMLLSVFANDQATFDKLWQYGQKYLDGKGLMNWNIDSKGTVIGTGSATDADEDIAYALIKASQKWGGNGYDTAAKKLISAIKTNEVGGNNYLNPGDNWGTTSIMNPSYLAPSYYKAYASFTGDSQWNTIASANTTWLQKAANSSTGLLPDWLNADFSPAAVNWDSHQKDFYYDAVRVPIRLLMSYKYDSDNVSQSILNKESSFFASVGVDKLVSGYTVGGYPISSYLDTTFLSGYAAAGQVNSASSFAQSSMSKLVLDQPTGYFGTTLRVLTLFIASGAN